MSEANDRAVETVEEDPHEGGFRPHAAITTERGGPRYGEFSEQVRLLMDNARYACPDDELVDELIEHLTAVNERLATVRIDEWHSPAGTRIDLPSRGNITLPPYEVVEASEDGVVAELVFRDFHLGGNAAAHGGHVAVAFDDIGGYASAVAIQHVSRTAYLNVQYRSITPLNTTLRVRAWAEKIEGRKVFIKGTMHDGDRLCAEMDALFIKLKPGQA
ncbi:PaaI family thioesterase [Gordonia rubripertincta]|uniref:Acyl-coenzyme A thioesterase THEM4 n=1 Tax=Gordonia rubripertincta TaxID=36822 RepID=A0AAW6RDF0_GORRU|nr:PaaI family thioesterase [Gordonia rubripertincta]MBM7277776.1 PaaI family thioesterase [Gordonia rubripertincta]MDG6782613.1 PaaI family thioesterase [Gordonia rubripertincta]NKY62124.1 PaaI family thioesterase [Gordonia rubripertincta]TSD96311.1 PaaI family thioesterase [Gordonia rubripertincta]